MRTHLQGATLAASLNMEGCVLNESRASRANPKKRETSKAKPGLHSNKLFCKERGLIIKKQAITRGLRPMFGRVIFINIKWIFLVQGDVCGDLALIPTLPLSLNSSDLTITNVS